MSCIRKPCLADLKQDLLDEMLQHGSVKAYRNGEFVVKQDEHVKYRPIANDFATSREVISRVLKKNGEGWQAGTGTPQDQVVMNKTGRK